MFNIYSIIFLFFSFSLQALDNPTGYKFIVKNESISFTCSVLTERCIPEGEIVEPCNKVAKDSFFKYLLSFDTVKLKTECSDKLLLKIQNNFVLSKKNQERINKKIDNEILTLDAYNFLLKMKNWSPFSVKDRSQVLYIHQISSDYKKGLIPSIAYIISGIWGNNISVIEKGIISFLQYSLWDFRYDFPFLGKDKNKALCVELEKVVKEIQRLQIDLKILPIFIGRFEALIEYLEKGEISLNNYLGQRVIDELSSSKYWQKKIGNVFIEKKLINSEKITKKEISNIKDHFSYNADSQLSLFPIYKKRGRYSFVLKILKGKTLTSQDIKVLKHNVYISRFPILSLLGLYKARRVNKELIYVINRNVGSYE